MSDSDCIYATDTVRERYQAVIRTAGETQANLSKRAGRKNPTPLSRLLHGGPEFIQPEGRPIFLEPLFLLYQDDKIPIEVIIDLLEEASRVLPPDLLPYANNPKMLASYSDVRTIQQRYGPLDRKNGGIDARILDWQENQSQQETDVVVTLSLEQERWAWADPLIDQCMEVTRSNKNTVLIICYGTYYLLVGMLSLRWLSKDARYAVRWWAGETLVTTILKGVFDRYGIYYPDLMLVIGLWWAFDSLNMFGYLSEEIYGFTIQGLPRPLVGLLFFLLLLTGVLLDLTGIPVPKRVKRMTSVLDLYEAAH